MDAVLRITVGCVLFGLLVWLGAFRVDALHDVDAALLRNAVAADDADPPTELLTDGLLVLIEPPLYALICLLIVGYGFLRGAGRRAAAAAGVTLVAANVTTQILKSLLAEPRFHESLGHQVAAASWPSGHVTGGAAAVVAAVLVAPPERRPLVAKIAALVALALSFAVAANSWHYPSDALGGLAVAGAWGSAMAAWLSSRRPAATTARRRRWLRATG